MRFTIAFKQLIFAIIILSSNPVKAQNFILPNAYAHNDYWHKRPLFDALDNGFTYIEADIYLRKEKLIVAHILPWLKKKKTLEELYLMPLLQYVEKNKEDKKLRNDTINTLTLMIDIKSDPEKTYTTLARLLEKYRSILSGYDDHHVTIRNVTIVITGHKPKDLVNASENRLIFMDADLRQTGRDSSNNVYPIASCKYSRLVKWKDTGNIHENEIQRLLYYVKEAHKSGIKVRLWASPENKAVWAELLKCNVDLINTNRLKALRKFLISDRLLVIK